MMLKSKLPLLIWVIIILELNPFCLCQLLGRIYKQLNPSIDDFYEDPGLESDRHEDDYHHPHHPHSHHQHNNHRFQPHQHRTLVNRDRLTSASVRSANDELLITKKQLALIRELNQKIDREFRKKYYSKPLSLQLAASDPVLCKSSLGTDIDQTFRNPWDSPSGLASNRKPTKALISAKNRFSLPNNKLLLRKPIFEFPEPELIQEYGPDITGGHSHDFSFNKKKNNFKSFRSFETFSSKPDPKALSYGYEDFDKYISDMFGKSDDLFAKSDDPFNNYPKYKLDDKFLEEEDVLDSNEKTVTQMPRMSGLTQNFDDFRPTLKMTKIPENKFLSIQQTSSRLLNAMPKKNKISNNFFDFDLDLGIDRNDKKTQKKEENSNKSPKINNFVKHPDRSYSKLGLNSSYPKENDKNTFSSAGYLDVLPQSKH